MRVELIVLALGLGFGNGGGAPGKRHRLSIEKEFELLDRIGVGQTPEAAGVDAMAEEVGGIA